MASAIRVYIVDSRPVFCLGIQTVLETTTDLQLLGTATSLEQSCSWATNLSPDVLLVDANLSHDSLLETISAWKQKPQSHKILVMLTHPHQVCLRQVTDQGANGCILKTDAPQRFIEAIRTIADGGRWFSRQLMQETMQTQLKPMAQLQLTEQDKLILQLICVEKSNHEIAETLHLSERTVCRYLEEIYAKLGVRTRVGAAVQAIKQGLA
ncbi:hypothetical protein MNBD_CHLOROFLEXI01-173 [hydrothermal vent metagenome]|uniref:Two-component transcriptional response regulator, LuxR family n=1 Tax=hydrothermal vent metagenome TaxID=652676 RepID=A0A3B0V0N9_9ZZZZ